MVGYGDAWHPHEHCHRTSSRPVPPLPLPSCSPGAARNACCGPPSYFGWCVVAPSSVAMAKSKNHTAHNQSYKAHRNGIKRPARNYHPSRKGVRAPRGRQVPQEPEVCAEGISEGPCQGQEVRKGGRQQEVLGSRRGCALEMTVGDYHLFFFFPRAIYGLPSCQGARRDPVWLLRPVHIVVAALSLPQVCAEH
eukprot:contig_13557_g3250